MKEDMAFSICEHSFFLYGPETELDPQIWSLQLWQDGIQLAERIIPWESTDLDVDRLTKATDELVQHFILGEGSFCPN